MTGPAVFFSSDKKVKVGKSEEKLKGWKSFGGNFFNTHYVTSLVSSP